MQNEKCYSSAGTSYKSAVRLRGETQVLKNEREQLHGSVAEGKYRETISIQQNARGACDSLYLSLH